MIFTRHDGLTAEALDTVIDTLVVGGHIHLTEHAADLLVNSLDDSLSAENCQRLAREASRRITGRDNRHKLHNGCKGNKNCGKNRILSLIYVQEFGGLVLL